MTGRALITGGAGFIGSHLVDWLLDEGWDVVVADNFDPSYPRRMKRRNITRHRDYSAYSLHELDIRDAERFDKTIAGDFTALVHFAGKAGPRLSLLEPEEYKSVNVEGTRQLLDFAHRRGIPQFVFASSSSVYGANPSLPWREDDLTMPMSPYAETKLRAEQLGKEFSERASLRFVALRFFTVYGPRQRPDLAIHRFAERMIRGEKIQIFGDGSALRDFTLVGDLIRGVRAAMELDGQPFDVINLGSDRAISVLEMVRALEGVLGTDARIEWCPASDADVPATWADIAKASRLLGYGPPTSFDDGLRQFASWLMTEQDGVKPVNPEGNGL